MKLCSNNCIPCCDFCKYVVHGDIEVDGTSGPLYCGKYDDDFHNKLAEWCGYCDDFYCGCAEENEND